MTNDRDMVAALLLHGKPTLVVAEALRRVRLLAIQECVQIAQTAALSNPVDPGSIRLDIISAITALEERTT